MALPPTSQIEVERLTDRVVVRLARPERRNALDLTTLAELVTVLEAAEEALPLVLTGTGSGFCIGADIRELAHLDGETAAAWSRLGQLAVAALERWPGVTIAHLHGWALGPGLELALACDLMVGTPDVRLALPGLVWGLLPGLGGLRRLSGRVTPQVRLGLFLRGDVLNGPRAVHLGLLNQLVADDVALDALIASWVDFPAGAVAAVRELRQAQLAPADPEAEIRAFATPFFQGECQRRLRMLLE